MGEFIRAGTTLIVATFLIVILYFLISPFTENFFDTMLGADMSAANSERDLYIPHIKTCLNFGLAIAIVTPAMIFIFRIFERNPEWYYTRRRY